jgi:hypothetical protein
MRITRLYLRNYRVYEEELDLEIPPGLVGIVGVNGAGKSYLLESILFGLYGHSRTTKDDVRTTGVNGDCIVEVQFEHEGHLYEVRRTISGINSTVKAQVTYNGQQTAEGVTDTNKYMHSVLGMDATAFRSSVFAEQKQVAAFSEKTPTERRKLVMRLLGITPLDGARDAARKDAKLRQDQLEHLRKVLPDLDELRATLDNARADAELRVAGPPPWGGSGTRRCSATPRQQHAPTPTPPPSASSSSTTCVASTTSWSRTARPSARNRTMQRSGSTSSRASLSRWPVPPSAWPSCSPTPTPSKGPSAN